MNASSSHSSGNEAPTGREPGGTARHDEILRSLDRLALRTAARARSQVRARIAAASRTSDAPPATGTATGGGTGPGTGTGTETGAATGRGDRTGLLGHDDSSTALPSDIAVLPELPGWVASVLSVMRGSAGVLRPEYGSDGRVRDYTIVGVNHHELSGGSLDPAEFLGRPLSEVRPGARTSGMYALYAAALERDGPVSTDGIDYFDVVGGTLHSARLRGTVTPLEGQGLLLTSWVPVSESRIGHRIQESSRMGWAEWDLVTGKVQWSAGMRAVLGLSTPLPADVAAGEPTPTVASARDIDAGLFTVGRMIDAADLPSFEGDLRRLLAGEEISDREITMRIAGEERRVRWLGYARPAGAAAPESVLFAARDITEQERELRSALSDAERLRQEATAERRVSETLRKALTPPLPAVTPPWLSVSAAYVPSDQQIGGDWYKCRELPDGRVLVAVGDASGHGVDAASRAVQQRSALAGLAYTEGDPAQLSTALGEVVFSNGLDATATAVIGHLDPGTRVFRWASAGHPSPILVRDGVPRVLDAEHGLMLGVQPETDYPVNTTQLAPGDLLLLYTDGVVERRGHDLDSGVASLLEAVVSCAAGGTEAQSATDCLMSTLLGPEAEDDATILALHVAWGASPT